MPQTYACRKCGKLYSSEEYEEDRFCRYCGTYLMPEGKVSMILKRIGKLVRGRRKK